MKNLFSLTKLVALATCALTLGSCSRSEYAMLPQGSSYHGVSRVATPVPAASAAISTQVAEPVVATAPATTSEAPIATTTPAVQPVKEAAHLVAPAVIAASSLGTAAAATASPAPKLNVMQRLTLNKVTRKVDKLMQKAALSRHDNTAATSKTSAISGNLRTGLIFLLVGLLISLFSGISGIFGIIGAIFAVIGLVFIILWLLDQA